MKMVIVLFPKSIGFVPCCLERADLLALVSDVYCDWVTFPFGILGQVWYLIVWIPDPCCISNFERLLIDTKFPWALANTETCSFRH